MIDDILTEVKRLKNDAKLRRDIGDSDGASAVMDKAIAVVNSARTDSTSSAESNRLAAELADCWGIKGGILRRAGRLQEARDAYNTGRRFETGDSYNLTNSLVLELLIAPSRLDQLKGQIEAARIEVEKQIQSHRGGQWWAWADLALLQLLLGRQDCAEEAYRHFSGTGARASDYDSTVSVLEELSAKFDGRNETLHASLERAVAFLRRVRP